MSYAIGITFGILGAGWHLWWVRWRAQEIARGRTRRAWAALPLGIAGPVAAFFAALLFGGEPAVWVFLASAVASNAVVLLLAGRASRREGGPE